jgi:SAM-dependent methyltransferase
VTLEVVAFQSRRQWIDWQVQHQATLNAQHRDNTALTAALPVEPIAGHCVFCGTERRFGCAEGADPSAISLRESLLCQGCQTNARQRAVGELLFEQVDPGKDDIYVTEQSSHLYLQLRRHCRSVRGSEFTTSWVQRFYLWLWLARHGRPGPLRRENLTRLSFPDRSLDAIATLDVLEHVPDADRAFRQCARVLRPGGRLLMTVPFYSGQDASEQVARIGTDGTVEHLQPPEFHGDPLGGGVLCFHHFGWDLLDRLRDAGFSGASAVRLRDPARGLPGANWIFCATR